MNAAFPGPHSVPFLDPEWDEVSRIIDFSNCWDDDKPTGDYYGPWSLVHWDKVEKPRIWSKPRLSPLKKTGKPQPRPKPEPIITGQQKVLWWRHEMQEISEEALARLYNIDPAALHEAIQDEWAIIYEFWGGTPEEFRAEMRKPENIDKRRA
jgi:hypothetical protein